MLLRIAVSLALLMALPRAAQAACASNDDCKGRRVCKQGACVPPQACGADRDCPGDDICKTGYCATPSPEDGAVVPAPSGRGSRAAKAKAKTCSSDRDCPGEDVCGDAQVCVSPTAASSPPAPPQKKCRRDKDCPGDGVCGGGVCEASKGSAQK